MTSKVIRLVERMKDKDELALEALFRSEPVADDGFSRRVVARVRRRIWLRRLVMPVALALGSLFAFRPAVELIGSLQGLVDALPVDLRQIPVDAVPQTSTFIVTAALIVIALFFAPALED